MSAVEVAHSIRSFITEHERGVHRWLLESGRELVCRFAELLGRPHPVVLMYSGTEFPPPTLDASLQRLFAMLNVKESAADKVDWPTARRLMGAAEGYAGLE